MKFVYIRGASALCLALTYISLWHFDLLFNKFNDEHLWAILVFCLVGALPFQSTAVIAVILAVFMALLLNVSKTRVDFTSISLSESDLRFFFSQPQSVFYAMKIQLIYILVVGCSVCGGWRPHSFASEEFVRSESF